jgi:hypothetical protein
VRKLFALIFVLVSLLSCKQNDPLVAEAFHHKLYLSEVKAQLPCFSSKEDSLLFMEQYVEAWILHQTMLAHALQNLTQQEQNLVPQMKQYKEQLLINACLQKLSSQTSQFAVSHADITDFLNETKPEKAPEYRNMVKLNYIKLSENSKLYWQIKDLFFDEKDRAKAFQQLELLCADTIEYYLDGDHWFYADYIEKDLPLTFSNENIKDKHDIVREGYRYLITVLDRKKQLQSQNVYEDRKMAQALLLQQKRIVFVNNYQDSIVKKAINEKKAIHYPIVY